MDEHNIITTPKTISNLIVSYFKVFLQHYKLLLAFNVLVLIGFYFFVAQIEHINFSDNYIWNYINRSLYYFLYFTIPVSFIYTFFFSFTQHKFPNIKNIIDLFLDHYVHILIPSALLCLVIFTLNFTVKSELLMYQLQNPLTFVFVEVVNTILYFWICFILLHFSPYKTSLKNYLNHKLIKYSILVFTLLMISMFLYRIGFNLIIITLNIFEQFFTSLQLDYLYKYGSIAVEFGNTIAMLTTLLFTYFTFTSESKNEFQINAINEISGLNDDDDEQF